MRETNYAGQGCSSLDLISSSKGQLETCMKSSVAERQFQTQSGIICFVSDSHWLGLRELVSWASSSLRHFFWDSSGLLTMFLGSGWLDFSCQFRGVAMASPGLGVSWFRLLLGSNCWHPDALSNFHSASEQIGQIKSKLPVGVNSPIVVELEVCLLEM